MPFTLVLWDHMDLSYLKGGRLKWKWQNLHKEAEFENNELKYVGKQNVEMWTDMPNTC